MAREDGLHALRELANTKGQTLVGERLALAQHHSSRSLVLRQVEPHFHPLCMQKACPSMHGQVPRSS